MVSGTRARVQPHRPAGAGNSAQVPQYDVIMYEGFPLESYPEEARKELKPEKRLLSIRVEAGVQFHAEGRRTMFEGRILG